MGISYQDMCSPFFSLLGYVFPQEQMTRGTHVLGNSIPGITNILDYHIEIYDFHFDSQLIGSTSAMFDSFESHKSVIKQNINRLHQVHHHCSPPGFSCLRCAPACCPQDSRAGAAAFGS